MKTLIFFLILICSETRGQNIWKEKDIFLMGGAELGLPVYDNVTGSVFAAGICTRAYVAVVSASLRYNISPVTDFGIINSISLSAGFCTPLRYAFSAFIETGAQYAQPGRTSENGFTYSSDGAMVLAGLNYRPADPRERLLITVTVSGFSYNLFRISVRKGGHSVISSIGVTYRMF